MCKQFYRAEFAGEETVKTFEFYFKQHRIAPGDIVRLKESHHEYRFSSVETVLANGVSWLNLHDLQDGFKIKSYAPGKIAGVIRKNYGQ